MPEPLRLRFVNPLVGVFALAVLAVVLIFFLLLIRAKRGASGHVEFEVRVPQERLGDLRLGADVRILGSLAGRVDRIDYAGGGKQVIVGLAIQRGFARQIFTDSAVRLRRREGLSGDALDIMRGERSETALVDVAMKQPIEIARFQADEDRIEQLADEIRRLRAAIERMEKRLPAGGEEGRGEN